MAEIDITLTVYCVNCGKDIDADWDWKKHQLDVTPCANCVEMAVNEAKDEANEEIASLKDKINDLEKEIDSL
jgi:hypothetical protein